VGGSKKEKRCHGKTVTSDLLPETMKRTKQYATQEVCVDSSRHVAMLETMT
jgi:hypothetical protein